LTNFGLKQVERARQEANLAQRRYMQVEPENRLVADTLEAEWNRRLQALAEARLEYERQCSLDRQLLVRKSERRSWRWYILPSHLERSWNTGAREEAAGGHDDRGCDSDTRDRNTMHVRFKGGLTRTLACRSR